MQRPPQFPPQQQSGNPYYQPQQGPPMPLPQQSTINPAALNYNPANMNPMAAGMMNNQFRGQTGPQMMAAYQQRLAQHQQQQNQHGPGAAPGQTQGFSPAAFQLQTGQQQPQQPMQNQSQPQQYVNPAQLLANGTPQNLYGQQPGQQQSHIPFPMAQTGQPQQQQQQPGIPPNQSQQQALQAHHKAMAAQQSMQLQARMQQAQQQQQNRPGSSTGPGAGNMMNHHPSEQPPQAMGGVNPMNLMNNPEMAMNNSRGNMPGAGGQMSINPMILNMSHSTNMGMPPQQFSGQPQQLQQQQQQQHQQQQPPNQQQPHQQLQQQQHPGQQPPQAPSQIHQMRTATPQQPQPSRTPMQNAPQSLAQHQPRPPSQPQHVQHMQRPSSVASHHSHHSSMNIDPNPVGPGRPGSAHSQPPSTHSVPPPQGAAPPAFAHPGQPHRMMPPPPPFPSHPQHPHEPLQRPPTRPQTIAQSNPQQAAAQMQQMQAQMHQQQMAMGIGRANTIAAPPGPGIPQAQFEPNGFPHFPGQPQPVAPPQVMGPMGDMRGSLPPPDHGHPHANAQQQPSHPPTRQGSPMKRASVPPMAEDHSAPMHPGAPHPGAAQAPSSAMQHQQQQMVAAAMAAKMNGGVPPPQHPLAQSQSGLNSSLGMGVGMGMGMGLGMMNNLKVGNVAGVPPPPSAVPLMSRTLSTTSSMARSTPAPARGGENLHNGLPPGAIPNRTRVVPVPIATSNALIPPLSPDAIIELKETIKKDQQYEAVWREMRERMHKEFSQIGGEKAWWERDGSQPPPRTKFGVTYPHEKRSHADRTRKKAGRALPLRLSRRVRAPEANIPEILVPIRLEFDVDQHKFKETFMWNLNDPVITPEQCAQSIAEDFKLSSSYASQINKSIAEQLSDFRAHVSEVVPAPGREICGTFDDDDCEWWEGWRKRLRTESGYVKIGRDGSSRALSRKLPEGDIFSNEPELDTVKGESRTRLDAKDSISEMQVDGEFRVLMKIDIVVGTMKLDDQFEWDISDESNSPELFAEVYTNELGLSGEFRTAITHSIQEQLHTYQRSLFLAGFPKQVASIPDAELKEFFLPTVTSGTVARNAELAASYTPFLNLADELELALGAEREKKKKGKVRQTTRRRVNALPEREAIRTHRTPAIGFPDIDPSTLVNGVLNATSGATTSRRAAAAAASVNIANMVASENGSVVLPTPERLSHISSHSNSKQSKAKGLFKAPPYPSSVLKPRAVLVLEGAIPSTAIEREGAKPADAAKAMTDEDGNPLVSLTGERRNTNKVPSAKRLKELEREEKEKEYAKRQHANLIDGVWHCSNCGIPESIAIGRRKGPLGDKSQCGDCGKYYHRYRKPREVPYNTDLEYHLAQRDGGNKKKTAASALRNLEVPETPADSLSPAGGDSPAPYADSIEPTGDGAEHLNIKQESKAPSSRGSSSEPLLAHTASKSSMEHFNGEIPPPPPEQETYKLENGGQMMAVPLTPTAAGDPSSPRRVPPKPDWLMPTFELERTKFPEDKFEPTLRKMPNGTMEWWVKCLDCPGKFYKTGPDETLTNFEIHLKNRLHRRRVSERINPPDPNPEESQTS